MAALDAAAKLDAGQVSKLLPNAHHPNNVARNDVRLYEWVFFKLQRTLTSIRSVMTKD